MERDCCSFAVCGPGEMVMEMVISRQEDQGSERWIGVEKGKCKSP